MRIFYRAGMRPSCILQRWKIQPPRSLGSNLVIKNTISTGLAHCRIQILQTWLVPFDLALAGLAKRQVVLSSVCLQLKQPELFSLSLFSVAGGTYIHTYIHIPLCVPVPTLDNALVPSSLELGRSSATQRTR